jgi:ligand-binding SRPBCC domain-containing protein
MYVLSRQQVVPRPREELFPFFADAGNLSRITPPALGFRILNTGPIEMRVGARIDYRIKIAGLPVRWQTVIEAWEPPMRFVDVQSRGPYAHWHHTHTFEPIPEGTLMRDRIEYALPFGPLGHVVQRLFVARQLETIFAFREQTIRALFPPRAGL